MARVKRTGKRRNKVVFKWTKEFILFLVGLAICIGVMIFCLVPTQKKKFYDKWSTSDNNLAIDNSFEEISYNSLKKKIENNELVYVYYATAKDDDSKKNLGIVDHYTNKHEKSNVATHYKVDKVYIYNADEAYDLNSEDENKVNELQAKADFFNSIKANADIKDISMNTYSQLWIFENGKLVFSGNDILTDSQASTQGSNFTLVCIKFLSYKLTDEDVTK